MSDRSRFLEGLEPLDVEETWPMLLGGRYRIVRPMGQGGYGRVFEAVDLLTEQTVAIKQLRPHGLSPATDRVRFLNEARTLEALENTVIVTLHDTANPDDEVPFFVMEFIEGETLAAYLRRRRYLSVREVFLIAARLLEGLAAVHEVGVVHRDIKPGNVVLKISDLGEISLKLLDFGLSGRFGIDPLPRVTKVGHVVGTPGYMAPEQLLGCTPDPRSDLFSLGITMYQALTAHRPFEPRKSADLAEYVRRVTRTSPDPPSRLRPGLGEAVDDVILRALRRQPAERYQDAAQMRVACDGLLARLPVF